jgi:hypothetical protein
MYTNELNPLKGWPSPYAVDKTAEVADPSVTINNGSVMSLDAAGDFELGLNLDAVAIFALQNSDDFDVVGDDGNLVGASASGTQTAKMSGLVALGAYELESTEYLTSGTYAPNDPLTSPVPGAANAGTLQVGVAYTNTICGVVSDGVVANERAINVLRFWPTWLPRTP